MAVATAVSVYVLQADVVVLAAVETVASTYALFAASVPATGALVSDILLVPIVSAPVIVPPASGM